MGGRAAQGTRGTMAGGGLLIVVACPFVMPIPVDDIVDVVYGLRVITYVDTGKSPPSPNR